MLYHISILKLGHALGHKKHSKRYRIEINDDK
jgi:hypothetical protein